jgi:crotonobetainyl-CoA:carnitine CoA-transferase CaiB-like acyl-CoA transferase
MPRRIPLYKDERARNISDQDLKPDPNRAGLFNNYNRNKLGITINMQTPEGRDLAERLIAKSSIVTENFARGVMENWGLTYDRLRELSPNVILAHMNGFGRTGPYADYRQWGPVVQAFSGLTFVAGLPDREPSGWGYAHMDYVGSYFAIGAILTAIFHRNRTGEGVELEIPAAEAGVGLLGPALLDLQINGKPGRRPGFPTGNRLEHPNAAPHGVYPCAGSDRWCAIAVFNDDEWRGLRQAIGDPAWAQESSFGSQQSRFEHQETLDANLSDWTRTRDPHEVMDLLQRHGVRAAAVQDAQDLNERDPQLRHRGLFFELDHPVIGPARFEGVPIKFSDFAPDNWRSAPLIGEDNEYVFKNIVGLCSDEFDELVARGVI